MTAFSPIAIVGRAAVLPGALSVESLWEQVSQGTDLTSDAPPDRWGVAPEDILCDDPDNAGDRTWSRRGGYVRGFEHIFDPTGFALSVAEIKRLDPLFQWTLHTARAALRDAGTPTGRVGAIFGNLSFPSAGLARFAESQWLASALPEAARARLGLEDVDPRNRFMSGLPALLLKRAMALSGECFALDAACASSLYAIKMACDALHDNTADVMLAGAVNCSDDLFIHVGFCALNAMSRTGQSRPFHAGADGLVPAEGAAFVALKRLEDAERDGDTIHGVIRGVGLANDGRARGLLAPAEEGQIRAMSRAYSVSGIDPAEITLLECHATGTPVGDATEVRSSAAVFGTQTDLPLGSLKSNTGHLITAAGAAGLIKVLEAMRAGVRPPTLHVEEPNPALKGTPFRLLTEAEPWTGRRLAGISAFGFGGNNAHLIVEQYPLGDAPVVAAPLEREEIAIVGVGIAAGSIADQSGFIAAMHRGFDGHQRATNEITLDLKGMKFPPNDLKRALGQQLLMMRVADEAIGEIDALPRETTGVMVGMGADPQVARYGARWRLATWGKALGADPDWVAAARDGVVPLLKSAGVLGTMPNIPANRLNSQYDLGGPSCAVSAEENSGLAALRIAVRALQVGELDAALVGAVDLSVEPVHTAAAAALLPADRQVPGDGAVALVLKRVSDAERAGDRIYALIGGPGGAALPDPGTALGHVHAAAGLLNVACGALSLHHRVDITGQSVHTDRATVTATAMEGGQHIWHLRRPTVPAPMLVTYAGADQDDVLDALRSDRQGGSGPAQLVLVAETPEELDERRRRAERHLVGGAPAGEGVHFRAEPIGGEIAAVFTGAGLAYPGLGRELLSALPELATRLDFPHLTHALDLPEDPAPLQMLWGASALCQLHAILSRDILGIQPDAVIGYSSGETNALLATGAWRDLSALYRDTHDCGLFDHRIGGDFAAVSDAWGEEAVDWSVWSVMVDEAELTPLLADEPRAHLAIRHTGSDLVIAGDTDSCGRILRALPGARSRPLDYNLAVHVPELDTASSAWLDLHRRPTFPVPGIRFYSTAAAAAYAPDTETAAQAILAQAVTTLDLPGVIEQAWDDGVRVFIEHGPQAICASWIRRILSDREAVVVSLDRRGRGVRQVFEAIAALLAAGVSVDVSALLQHFAPAETPPQPRVRPDPAIPLRFPAHPAPVALPALRLETLPPSIPKARAPQLRTPTRVEAPMEPTNGLQSMSPAPRLPSAFDNAPIAPLPAPPVAAPTAAAAPAPAVPVAAAPASAVPAAAAPASAVPVAAGSTDPLAAVYTRHQAHVAQLATMHQEFLASQAQLHQQFMTMRQSMMMSLLHQSTQPMAPAPAALPAPAAPRPAPVAARPAPAQAAPSVRPAPSVRAAPAPRPAPRAAPVAARPAPAPAAPKARPAPVAARPQPTPAASTPAPVVTPATTARPGHLPGHAVPAAGPAPTGLTLDRQQLHTHSSGRISEIFGPQFAQQDGYAVQVRMPEPPLLLADRMTGIDAEPGSMKKGTIWTETDVTWDSWWLNAGRMPAGIMIESGQADLMLISYLGIDFLNQGERAYRLLGCELTYHRDLPAPGETLCYDIHVDGHANQGPIRLFFFHYDCRINGQPAISVRKGQAGFFTVEDLAESAGVLWSPEEQEIRADARMDPPEALTAARSFTAEQVRAFSEGRPWECFGPTHFWTQTHTRTPSIQSGDMLFMQDVTRFDPSGGPWKRGYLKIEVDISPDDWFFEGHFKNDPCMPGTLMFEGCLQAMAFYLTALGFTTDRDGWRFQPVSGVAYPLRCRGQVTPTSKKLTYEIFVEEVIGGPNPTLFADLLCTVDGLKAFHARGMGLELVPDWPMTSRPEFIQEIAAIDAASGPVATDAEGFPFDYASLMACAWGRPSEAFGSMYKPFDGHRRVARLPGPPYHFMSRVTRIDGELGKFKPGVTIELEYDIPPDSWYFTENGHPTMPFCVLLEAALQPCGWLASAVGSALAVDRDLSFRNLDGTGTMHVELLPDVGTFRTVVTITNISNSAGMIIESFDVNCYVGDTLVYDLKTVFGFFPEEALKNQIGLPTTDAQRGWLTTDSDFAVDLTARPEKYCTGGAQLAEPMMLMLDRVSGFWPDAGEAGLGILRGEKDVDPSEWFFKAHFFQDPVQPGSLGLEAMLQLLQFYMLETGMADGIADPHFEPLALQRPMTWKYRGQVTPNNALIASTIEITEIGSDEGGPFAIAKGSLWVDGKRIYESPDMGMRIVSGGGKKKPELTEPAHSIVLDPKADAWLSDHRPTFNRPALPMMSMVDMLASAAAESPPGTPARTVTGMKNVRVHRWVDFEGPRTLHTTVNGDQVSLMDGEEIVATATVQTGAYLIPPTPLAPLSGEACALPYETGALFHGPTLQLMTRWVLSHEGASSILDPARSGAPIGTLSPGLLDAATHGIPHDGLEKWDPDLSPDKVAYPALITTLSVHGPTPTHGDVRCEVRYKGTLGSADYPMFDVQLIAAGQVWVSLTLVEACFPKGPLGSAPPAARRDFLQHHRYVPGLRLSDDLGDCSVLHTADVAQTDWLPGTVQGIYGTTDPEKIAIKEHDAARTGIHPAHLPGALPMSILPVQVTHSEGLVTVRSDGPESLDLTDIRTYWTGHFDRDPWPVEDLYYGLIQRFVRRVVLEDPTAMAALKGRSVMYLGNHQTGIESLLFSIIASAIGGVPTVTLAKIEHQKTWLGQLIKHCFDYPGVADPRVIAFFDRTDKASLPRIIGELGAEMINPGRSVMVHVEGTRSMSCRLPVEKMSGAFIDMALKVGAPIVPVRFTGGLPTEPLHKRIEFPIGMGRQDYWFGRPILPEDLAGMPYGDRKKVVVHAINSLGPDNAVEEPIAGDPHFARWVEEWQSVSGTSHEHATLLRVLQECDTHCPQTARLLDAVLTPPLRPGLGEEGAWLAELGRRLLGGRR